MRGLSPRFLAAVTLVSIGLLLALATSWGLAFAQYPPPVGSVTTSVVDTAPATGTSVTCTCAVLDTQGNPVAGEVCTFTIVSQPGTDASLSSTTAVTNAQGIATVALSTGSIPGPIVVRAEARGIQSQVTVNAQAPGVAPPTLPPGAVPAAPPPTGAGQDGEPGGLLPVWIGAIAGAVALALLSFSALWPLASRPRSR